MKLEEGKRYDFFVERKVKVGDSTYFLLTGPGGVKCLLREKYYKHYGIQVESIINCRVDKINCRGEIFLEPENPHYREGEEYDFLVTGRDVRINESGELMPVLLVKDKFNIELVVPLSIIGPYNADADDYIRLKIRRITKGRIFFIDPENHKKSNSIDENAEYDFMISDRIRGMDGKDYFIVYDNANNKYSVPVDPYAYYGLEKGKTFRGRYLKYHDTGQYKIEPLNPYYEEGNTYEFELLSVNDMPDRSDKILLVGDKYGLKHKVLVPFDYKPAEKPVFKVEKIRKGWPLLVPV
ncbi:MAG: hypothetical protein U9N72_08595 [Bacteroidota bacterium]|nr:hypothetical protein [Bacteroidota bacterium]